MKKTSSFLTGFLAMLVAAGLLSSAGTAQAELISINIGPTGFNIGGVSEVFGNLNLTQASFLNFGTGTAGNLTFGTYAPGALLTINNFAPGNTLVFGSDLRSTINNSSFFSFTNGGIGSSSWNEGTSTFTITAIPETSTYLAAIGLLALMPWPLCRRLRGQVS